LESIVINESIDVYAIAVVNLGIIAGHISQAPLRSNNDTVLLHAFGNKKENLFWQIFIICQNKSVKFHLVQQ